MRNEEYASAVDAIERLTVVSEHFPEEMQEEADAAIAKLIDILSAVEVEEE